MWIRVPPEAPINEPSTRRRSVFDTFFWKTFVSSEKKETDEKKVAFGFREVPESEKAEDVKQVFDSVAAKYDLMNDLLSFGLHRFWKHCTINEANLKEGYKVLDIASGTCDLALAFSPKVGKTGEVWATDINYAMLSEGAKRVKKAAATNIQITQCDCEALPFAENTFDVVTVSFGLRNMTHKENALREMLRVTKPGGRVLVLEFSHCWKIFRPFYDFYSFVVMPRVGALVAGDAESYRYLAESIRVHPNQETLAKMMREAGFANVSWKNFTFGVCALHIGMKG